jgi:hypothetical protein
MATACIPQTTGGFEPKGKPTVATFDQGHASTAHGRRRGVLRRMLARELEGAA